MIGTMRATVVSVTLGCGLLVTMLIQGPPPVPQVQAAQPPLAWTQTAKHDPDSVPVRHVPAVVRDAKPAGSRLPHIRHHRVHRLHAWRYARHAGVGNGRCDSCRVVRRVWHFLH